MARYLGVIVVALALCGCTATPQVQNPPPASPPPRTADMSVGDHATRTHQACMGAALTNCPGFGARCTAYQDAYTRTCMIRAGVPADYVLVLMGPAR